MGTPEERKKNDSTVDMVLKQCCKDDEHAFDYLAKICFVSRVFDDQMDKDYSVPDKMLCEAYFILLAGLWDNPFFREHESKLIPLHIASFNSFMDSNKWAKEGDSLRKIYAHVIKDFINELLGVVAYIVGGYDHMRVVSMAVKEAFLEELEEN
jgi:hypothetical protein